MAIKNLSMHTFIIGGDFLIVSNCQKKKERFKHANCVFLFFKEKLSRPDQRRIL